MKPRRDRLGHAEIRDVRQVAMCEQLQIEHNDYRSPLQAAKARMDE